MFIPVSYSPFSNLISAMSNYMFNSCNNSVSSILAIHKRIEEKKIERITGKFKEKDWEFFCIIWYEFYAKRMLPDYYCNLLTIIPVNCCPIDLEFELEVFNYKKFQKVIITEKSIRIVYLKDNYPLGLKNEILEVLNYLRKDYGIEFLIKE